MIVFACFNHISANEEIGTDVLVHMNSTVKEPCLELLASSGLIDWDTFQARIQKTKTALEAFEVSLDQYKKLPTKQEIVAQPISSTSSAAPSTLPITAPSANNIQTPEPEATLSPTPIQEEPLPVVETAPTPTEIPVQPTTQEQPTPVIPAPETPTAIEEKIEQPAQPAVAPEVASQPAEQQATETPPPAQPQPLAPQQPEAAPTQEDQPLTAEEMKEAEKMLEFFKQMAKEEQTQKPE